MKKSTHTPGPWKVYTSGVADAHTVGAKDERFELRYWVGYGETQGRGPGIVVDCVNPYLGLVSLAHERRPIAKANAHLIAAAPEMLAALEQASHYIDACFEQRKPNDDERNLLELMSSAIKKARGE